MHGNHKVSNYLSTAELPGKKIPRDWFSSCMVFKKSI